MRTERKEKIYLVIMNIAGIVCLVLALALVLWSILSKVQFFKDRYNDILVWLSEFQLRVASIPNKWLLIFVIELIFISKILIPLPLSAIFMISGMVFPLPASIAINLCGILLLMTIKYFYGHRFGGGNIEKLLNKNAAMRRALKSEHNVPKGAILFIFRIVPSFPVNLTSQLYGAMHYNYPAYLLISAIGFIPKLMSYSVAGRNIFDPFSFKFTAPLIVIFTISGITMIGLNTIFNHIQKQNNKAQTTKGR